MKLGSTALEPGTVDRPAVLAVDDVEANLIALRALLEDMDCDVVFAKSGNDALRHLLRREFAVMLLDVQMPEMDGYEVAHHARRNPSTRDVPIIFLTAANNSEGMVLRGYGSGAVDFLVQAVEPFDSPQQSAGLLGASHCASEGRECQGSSRTHERRTENGLCRASNDACAAGPISEDGVTGGARGRRGPRNQQPAGVRAQSYLYRAAQLEFGRDTVRDVELDGKRRWFSTTKAPVRDQSGNPVGLVGIARDVTGRFEMEAALRSREEQLRLTFLASSAGLFDWNIETGKVDYSPSLTLMVGGSDLMGTSTRADLESRVHPDDLEGLQEAVRNHLTERAPLRAFELRVSARAKRRASSFSPITMS